MSIVALCLGACTPTACNNEEQTTNREVEILIGEAGPAVKEAKRRLLARGPEVIVILETGLYQADSIGRIRIVSVLRELGGPGAKAVLQHIATRDENELVSERAGEALSQLRQSASPKQD